MIDIDKLVRDHIDDRGLGEAYRNDTRTHITTQVARNVLRLVALAMHTEEIADPVIARVLHLVVFGAMPDPDDVRVRRDAEQSLVHETERRPAFGMVCEAPPGCPRR